MSRSLFLVLVLVLGAEQEKILDFFMLCQQTESSFDLKTSCADADSSCEALALGMYIFFLESKGYTLLLSAHFPETEFHVRANHD